MAKLFADAKRRNTQWIFEKAGLQAAVSDAAACRRCWPPYEAHRHTPPLPATRGLDAPPPRRIKGRRRNIHTAGC